MVLGVLRIVGVLFQSELLNFVEVDVAIMKETDLEPFERHIELIQFL